MSTELLISKESPKVPLRLSEKIIPSIFVILIIVGAITSIMYKDKNGINWLRFYNGMFAIALSLMVLSIEFLRIRFSLQPHTSWILKISFLILFIACGAWAVYTAMLTSDKYSKDGQQYNKEKWIYFGIEMALFLFFLINFTGSF